MNKKELAPFLFMAASMVLLSSCATPPKTNFTGQREPASYATVVCVPSRESSRIVFERINQLHSHPNVLDTPPSTIMVPSGNNTFSLRAEGYFYGHMDLKFFCEAGRIYLIDFLSTNDGKPIWTVKEVENGKVLLTASPPEPEPYQESYNTYNNYTPVYTPINVDQYKPYTPPKPSLPPVYSAPRYSPPSAPIRFGK